MYIWRVATPGAKARVTILDDFDQAAEKFGNCLENRCYD
jgi:hypothetical protein